MATSRDAWCYNFSKDAVWENIQNSIRFYNQQVDDYAIVRQERNVEVEDFIDTDSTKFSWDRAQRFDIAKGKKYTFNPDSVRLSIYRPFCKQTVYFNREMNNCVYQIPKLFPTPEHKNLVIGVHGSGGSKDFSCLITDTIPDIQLLFNGQWFPLFWYEEESSGQGNMFSEAEDGYIRHDGVTDGILERFRTHCMDPSIGKEDIFYFVYGYLHDPNYRTKFAADLKKMLPRLPLVGRSEFWAYSKAGRQLADLHLNYETQAPLPEIFVDIRGDNFRVEKMFFLNKELKDTIIVNPHIAVRNIPQIAYEYVVNGKSAIEWVMDRYRVVKDKDSGILNDPNEYSTDPRYILKLLLSVITVSVRTVQILRSFPYVREEGRFEK